MAKKEPEAPKPKNYHAALDLSLEDALSGYRDIYTEKSQKQLEKEMDHDWRDLYTSHIKHFEQHGKDEKTKHLKRTSYHDMNDIDKRKWVHQYLSDLVKSGMTKEYGEEAAALMLKNHDLVRQYVDTHMATKHLRSYDDIVDYLAEHEDIVGGFRTDEQIKAMIDTYTSRLSSVAKKSLEYQSRLGLAEENKDEHKKVTEFVNTLLKPHKKRLTSHATFKFMLGQIQKSASDDYKPSKKAKYLEELPEEKDKR